VALQVEPNLDYRPVLPKRTDRPIGIVGAGWIVEKCHLPAYRAAGFNVAAIASHTPAHARALAERFGIARVWDDYNDLLADPEVEIVDIAFPPERQLEVARAAAVRRRHILCQKPISWTYESASEIVRLAGEAGVKLAVNMNMRYDPAVRTTWRLLKQGLLGQPVLATIELRVRNVPQEFAWGYRNVFMNLSIHHLDCFRFWFGEPDRILVSQTRYPGQVFAGEAISLYVLEYADGRRCAAWDDGFTWTDDYGIRYRVEGTAGVAKGTIGWPDFAPSTLSYYSEQAGRSWIQVAFKDRWFPEAFIGPMAELMVAIEEDSEPELSGPDHLRSLRLALAGYRSVDEGRSVSPHEMPDVY
jgi:predicted dehydrogenase